MTIAAFLSTAPRIEDKGAVFLISPEDGPAWAMSRHEFEKFLELGRRAVMEGDKRLQEVIVPLCDLCVRHNLPRIDDPRAASPKREN